MLGLRYLFLLVATYFLTRPLHYDLLFTILLLISPLLLVWGIVRIMRARGAEPESRPTPAFGDLSPDFLRSLVRGQLTKGEIRILVIAVAAAVGGLTTLRESEAALAACDSCVEKVKQEISGPVRAPGPALAAARARLESCNQMYGGEVRLLLVPLMKGLLAFLGVALVLELVRFVVGWMIAGLRS